MSKQAPPRTTATLPLYGEVPVDRAGMALEGTQGTHANGLADQITARASELDSHEYYVWSGTIPAPRNGVGPVGTYWVPNPYRTSAIRREAEKTAKEYGWDTDRATRYVLRSRRGLRSQDIGIYVVAMAEADDGTIDEQLAWLDGLEKRTKLRWAVQTLSGDTRPESIAAAGVDPADVKKGKSVHAFLALKPTDLATWTAIQRHLVVLLRSDPAIANPDRLMRLPGVLGHRDGERHGDVRIQTLILARHTGTRNYQGYEARDVLARLARVATEEGIENIDDAFRALQYVGELQKRARKATGEDAEILRDLAAKIRHARAITEEDRDLASSVGVRTPTLRKKQGRKGKVALASTDIIPLPGDTRVYLADGASIALSDPGIPPEGYRCYDPELESPETSHSPSARIWPGGRLFSEAGSGRRTYVVDHNDGIGMGFSTPHMICTLAPKPSTEPATKEDTEPWRVTEIPSPEEAPVVLIATPMGSGKTTLIGRVLRDRGVGKALIVNPTIALSEAASDKFGAKLYSRVDGKIIIDDVWVSCAPSIRRFSVFDADGKSYVQPEMVIIEEIEHTFGILHSPNIMSHKGTDIRGKTYAQLARLLRSTINGGGQVVAMDANASDVAVRDLTRLTGHLDIHVISAPENARTMWTGQRESRYKERADIIGAILDKASDRDARGLIYTSSQGDLLALGRMLEAKGRTVLTVHGGSTPGEKATLGAVDTAWGVSKYDWILINDAAGSGVSLNTPGRDVYAMVRGFPGYTWANPTQGVARARNPKSVSSWIDTRESLRPIRHSEIRKNLLRQATETETMIYGEDMEGRPAPAPLNRSYFESLVDHVWITLVRSANISRAYYKVREETYGVKIVDAPELPEGARKAIDKMFTAARKAVQKKAVEDVVEAQYILDMDAIDLAGHGDLTPTERAELDKHRTIERWGEETEELIRDTTVNRGRGWKKNRNLVNTMLWGNGHQSVLRAEEQRHMEVVAKDGTRYTYRGQARNLMARAEESHEILRAAGAPQDNLLAGFKPLETEADWVPDPQTIFKVENGFTYFGFVSQDTSPQVFAGCQKCVPGGAVYISTPLPLGHTFWTDNSLKANGFVKAIRERAEARDYATIGLPALPKDFEERPSGWLGTVLGTLGIPTKRERGAPGLLDLATGKMLPEPEREAIEKEYNAKRAAWVQEKRAAKKAKRDPDPALKPPTKASYRSIDWDAYALVVQRASRQYRKMLGLRVPSVDELTAAERAKQDLTQESLEDEILGVTPDLSDLEPEPLPAPEIPIPDRVWAYVRDTTVAVEERIKTILSGAAIEGVKRVLVAHLMDEAAAAMS